MFVISENIYISKHRKPVLKSPERAGSLGQEYELPIGLEMLGRSLKVGREPVVCQIADGQMPVGLRD